MGATVRTGTGSFTSGRGIAVTGAVHVGMSPTSIGNPTAFAFDIIHFNVISQAGVAIAAADVRVDAAKPHFARAAQPDRYERWPALVQRHGVEAVVDVLLRDL